MKANKRIRTVLYEDQRLSSGELEILHTPAMQRLYGLRQLGLTDRVFIDASHARIHHVVGVLEQVDKLVSAIIHNLGQSKRELLIGSSSEDIKRLSSKELVEFVRERKPVMRLIGLLHDLTHAPFGHTVEDEIQLVRTKHDEPMRQADAFFRLVCQLLAWLAIEAKGLEYDGFPKQLKPFLSHGTNSRFPDAAQVGMLAKSLLTDKGTIRADTSWRLSRRDVAELLAQMNCAMTALLHLEALHKMDLQEKHLPRASGYEFQSVVRYALADTEFEPLLNAFEFQPQRDAFMLDIVGNTVCADLLDYAKRDSHFAGLKLDYDTGRIAENFTLIAIDEGEYERRNGQGGDRSARSLPAGFKDPFAGRCLRTAISLVSHKYRTDVPSELMNLLNVRFYLYERVIFHPTKCAAGSMLGAAMQLLGWRSLSTKEERPEIPNHLKFVGDDVFLHDIRAALDFILDHLSATTNLTAISDVQIQQLNSLDQVHSGLIPEILQRQKGKNISRVRRELEAARLLLDRLAARRYFRPVFRALPSSSNKKLQANAQNLADVFQQPEVRYEAEREIEEKLGLSPGTITIHCPTRTTAKKIANVFLLKPDPCGHEEIQKLKDIDKLDPATFGKHAEAVRAVEQMYLSMWRLMVYVAPEHLYNYEKISEVVGRVIVTKMDSLGQFAGEPETSWENDPHLMWELKTKLSQKPDAPIDAEDLADFGRFVGSVADELLRSGRLRNLKLDFDSPAQEIANDLSSRLAKALEVAFGTMPSPVPDSQIPLSRADDLLLLFKSYARAKKSDVQQFKSQYDPQLGKLSPQNYSALKSRLQLAVTQSQELQARAKLTGVKTPRRGNLLNDFRGLVDDELRKHGIVASVDDFHLS